MWCWKTVFSGCKHQSEIQRAGIFKYLTTNNLVHKTDWVFMEDSVATDAIDLADAVNPIFLE